MVEILDLVFTALRTVIPSSSSLLLDWLKICKNTEFFTQRAHVFNETETDRHWHQTVHALCTLITISFLDLDQDFSVEGAASSSYIVNPDSLIRVHNLLAVPFRDQTAASPALLSWGFVLRKISIRLEDIQNSMFNPLFKEFGIDVDSHDQDKAEQLGTSAGSLISRGFELGGFELIGEVLQRLPERLEYGNICATLALEALPYLTMDEALAGTINKIISPYDELRQYFFSDPFAQKALLLSKAKVPIAIETFLKLAQCLGSEAFEFIYCMGTYMQEFPRQFREYDFSPEKPSIVELSGDLSLFADRETDGQGGLVLPPGTRGEIIPGGKSTVVMWNLEYNGWSFLGRVLEHAVASGAMDDGIVLDILRLITNTVVELDESNAADLLASCSAGLGQGDIVELITKILDDALYSKNIEFCIMGVKFLTALTKAQNQRVWPYMGRSKLVERDGRGGLMGNILGAIEIVGNKYDFTLAVIDLVDKLVKDALSHSLDHHVSQRVKSEVLSKFVRHLVDVYESFTYWRYAKPRQQVSIASSIISIFTNIVYSTFRAEDGERMTEESKVTHVLSRSSSIIVEKFLSQSETCMRTLQPLLTGIASAAKSRVPLDSGSTGYLLNDELAYTEASLQFCSLLVRVRSLVQLPLSVLEKKLFSQSPELSLIFMRYVPLHTAVVDVLESIISAYCPEEQPSLLAHLGTDYSQMMITGLASAIRNELEMDVTVATICTYFSAIVDSKQEGLCILLLSGKDTRNTSNKVGSVDSLLNVMEQRVVRNSLPPKLADQMLDSIALAHSTWNMNMYKRQTSDDLALVEALLGIVEGTFNHGAVKGSSASQDDYIDCSHVFSMTSKAIKVLSIALYKAPANSETSKKILDLLKSQENLIAYSKEFLSVHGFRPSLHGNLHRNFDSKWPKGKLLKFVKSNLLPTTKDYGVNYLYDIGLLDIVLMHDSLWDGYRKEVVEANVNLSYVDSQVCLVKAWCSFLTCMTVYAAKNSDKAVLQQLKSTALIALEGLSEEKLFEDIFLQRIDLAFFIMFHLSKNKMEVCKPADFEKVFNLLADTSVGFLNAAGTSSSELGGERKLYRPLLKIVNLCLDGFTNYGSSDFQLIQTIHGLLDVVVIKGMKAVTLAIQHRPSAGGIEDMVQITMILRKCLDINGVSSLYGNLALLMSDTECDRSVMSLFSYSLELQFNGKGGDATFGEYALLYLLEWLRIDVMADRFVSNGLFGVLLESPISKLIQEGGIKPTVDSRLHAVWSKGILTICLELLRQLGSRIIPEMITFVNFFYGQIDYTLRSWIDMVTGNPASVITLSTVGETSQILILFDVITKLCEQDQLAQLNSYLPNNSDLIEAYDYLLSHKKFLASKVAVVTPEEQKLAQNDEIIDKISEELVELREFLAERED